MLYTRYLSSRARLAWRLHSAFRPSAHASKGILHTKTNDVSITSLSLLTLRPSKVNTKHHAIGERRLLVISL